MLSSEVPTAPALMMTCFPEVVVELTTSLKKWDLKVFSPMMAVSIDHFCSVLWR